jgi:hypothetical protein
LKSCGFPGDLSPYAFGKGKSVLEFAPDRQA